MSFKLSCQEHLVPGETFLEKVLWLEQNGFKGIEIWGFGISERIQEITAALSASSIKISAMCAGYRGNLIGPSETSISNTINEIKTLLRYCADLNSPGLIVVPSFGTSKPPGVLCPHNYATEREVEQLKSVLTSLGVVAAEEGVRLFVEPINRYESYVFNQIEEVVRAIEHPALRILADTYHMNIEEKNVCDVLAAHHEIIGHVHLADSNRLIPGLGHIGFQDILSTLNRYGYSGYLSLECFLRTQDDLLLARDYLLGPVLC